ncbi:hypothetical protein SAMN04487989_102239 [Bizionia echini]|uniref:Lipoprotein n=1 Tax=Bizionia echini TaxID=649333 RepID=A0A1I5ARQ8_9FLAO|nr:hypothetical protein [Bizionia echini]SFN65124.1 hypothetical protein SAMN04487989_102239 [Bizionia echini]
MKINKYCKFIILLSISVLSLNCSNDLSEDVENNQQNQNVDLTHSKLEKNTIVNDTIFINYIDNVVSQADKQVDLNSLNLILQKDQNTLTNQDLKDLAELLGYIDFNDMETYYEVQNERIDKLDKKYDLSNPNNIPILEQATTDVYNKHHTYVSVPGGGSIGSTCLERYNNCIAGALAMAVLEHFACAALDTTVVLGIICHSTVTALQISANNQCRYDLEDCI